MREIEKEIQTLKDQLEKLPKGTLVYKKINGKEQPYLQWTQDRKTMSRYIKVGERDQILLEIEKREEVKAQYRRLCSYAEKTREILKNNPGLDGQPGVGNQDFAEIMENHIFYVDKTDFIKEWWESRDQITLITRPRRFGKTLTLSMVEYFFSTRFAGKHSLFQDLKIWRHGTYRHLRGKYPVIFISFAAVKGSNYEMSAYTIAEDIRNAFEQHKYMLEGECLSEKEKAEYLYYLDELSFIGKKQVPEIAMVCAVTALSKLLYTYHGEKVLFLLDEYDTPLQEAYLSGYWNEMSALMRNIMNASLKTNQYIKKALLTGITRIARESLFSDLNSLKIYTPTSEKYSTYFGFTEQEVADALECQTHKTEEFQKVKEWYDGFIFGKDVTIYNPWSVLCYLSERRFCPYWVNTGGYRMISDLFLKGFDTLKDDLEILLRGESVHKKLDENIIFQNLKKDPEAIWSFLLAAGYLKAQNCICGEYTECDLAITNHETKFMFRKMVLEWFVSAKPQYNKFVEAMLKGETENMNYYMNEVALNVFSTFDVGNHPSHRAPELFYHGFVLGLLADLQDQYLIRSNRESGFGRYDVVLEPKKKDIRPVIMEFKVIDKKNESSLSDTADAALKQIKEKNYKQDLYENGFCNEQILSYGFAFEGKTVLIKKES